MSRAVQTVIDHSDWYREPPEVELLTVHLPVPRVAHTNKAQLERYYQEEGEGMLAAAKRELDRAGIPYKASALVGPVAETLVKHAEDKRCDLIYIGTRGMSEIGKALMGSTATKVLHISDVPVLLVK